MWKVRTKKRENVNEEAKEEENKRGKREVEKEDDKMVFKKRCANSSSSSSDFFEDCSSLEGSESFGDSRGHFCGGSCGFSVRVPARSPGVPVVTDVLVSHLSVGALGEDFLSGSDRQFGESRSFVLPRTRQAFRIDSQGGMSLENSPEEVPPVT